MVRYGLFLIMKLAPEYEGKETGVGKELVLKAVTVATGRTDRQIKESLNVVGDIGKVLAQGKGKVLLEQWMLSLLRNAKSN